MDLELWEHVVSSGFAVPAHQPLTTSTDALVSMLGAPDPHVRDELAYPVLCEWIARGVYDPARLRELGTRMCQGLGYRLGEVGTESVVRRTFSALILGEVVDSDLRTPYLTALELWEWREAAVSWLAAERDLRGLVPGLGWAHAVAHGADLLLTLARSPHLDGDDLCGLLGAVAGLLANSGGFVLVDAEDDRLAYATMGVLLRDLVPATTVELWLAGCADTVAALRPGEENHPARTNTVNYLRALYFQLSNGVRAMPSMPQPGYFDRDPAVRTAALDALTAALRRLDLGFWRPHR